MAGSLQIMSYNTKNPVWEQAFNNDILERIIGLSLIAIPIISIFLLKKLFKLAEQEACIQAQEALLDNVNDLFATVKSQRHDFINHIQVLYGLMQLKKYEEAADYLSQLVGETRKAEEILSVDNLAITALLKSKQALSVARKVTFETAINCSLQNLKIRSFDLVKILGNLLDNALDAAAEQDEDFRRVSLRIFRENGRLILQVSNPRPIIPREVTDKLFEEGYTTKEGNHSGEGLFIVKKLASQYGGTIEVLSDETNGTSFIVKLPC